jgi:proline iminopeptidase
MTASIREGYIAVTGGNVWFRIYDEDRPLTPLLVLHGGPGVPHDYLLPLSALSAERPVIFYDQLGCGNADPSRDTTLFTLERFVGELGQVRQALGLSRVFILGQSWGTMLAVDYMLTTKPAGVRGLILSGPCLSASRWGADQRHYVSGLTAPVRNVILEHEAGGNFSSPEYRAAMMEYYRRHLCRIDPWPDCLKTSFEKMAPQVYEYLWGPSEFTITGTLSSYERVDRLREIRVPVLFTCGRYDEATPDATAYYHTMLPGSELVIFEDASHEHHLEKEEEYLSAVRKFLRKVDEGT